MASNDRPPVGWTTGPFYYTPYFGDYWYTPGLTGTLQQAAANLAKTAEQTNKLLQNPASFAEQTVRGAIQGVSPPQQPVQPEGEAPPDLINATPPTLVKYVQHFITEGIPKAAAIGLEQILLNARTEDPALRDQALESLKKAKEEKTSLTDTAESVWKTLNSQHIVWGGVHLNATRSSNKELSKMREEAESSSETDGTSPINSLINCQALYETLRRQHSLPRATLPQLSESPSLPEQISSIGDKASTLSEEEIARLEKMTRETIERFCEKTIHYSTMYAMRTLFSQEIPPEEFNRMIQEGGDLEKRYLQHIGGGAFRQFIYKRTYRLIRKIIAPIIQETIEGVTNHLRAFLKDDVQMLKFAEAKIKDLSNYYGRIENGRKDYLRQRGPDHPGYEAGSFDAFLSMTLINYGENRLTEEQLIKRFGDFIVLNYTPRPQIKIFGYRIPLISKFLDWTVHSIRKTLIRFFLRRTRLINTILTQGTGSAQYAQLGLKKMLLTKLGEIVEMIQRSRPRTVTELSNERNPVHLHLEAKKARLITHDLHLAIQQHSANLHRFIAIQACNNRDEALSNLDNRIATLTSEVLSTVRDLFQWKTVSFQGVLEDATTNMLETSLLSLFEDKERQIESQMQGIFEVLENAYKYTPPENQVAQEVLYRRELKTVDDHLKELLVQLSSLAIEAAVEDQLKNASVERHRKIEEFVEKEKGEMVVFAQYLYRLNATLSQSLDKCEIGQVKEEVNEAIGRIEEYLREIAATLRGNALKADCYTDVRGDLYNAYAINIKNLEAFVRETLDPLLSKIKEIEEQKDLVSVYSAAYEKLESLSFDLLSDELEDELGAVLNLIPERDIEDLKGPLDEIQSSWEELNNINEQLRLFERAPQLEDQIKGYSQQLEQLELVRQRLNELRDKLKQFRNSQNPDVPGVQGLYNTLMQTQDSSLREHVLNLLRSENTDELHRKLHPPTWGFRSEVPVFTALNRYQLILKEQVKKSKQQQDELKEQTKTLNNEEIKQKKEKRIEQMNSTINSATVVIGQKKAIPIEALNSVQQCLLQDLKKFEEAGMNILNISEELKVNGYIAIGELKLAQNITPIVSTIAPLISESITHLLNSLGNPFHYKQLMLRLVLLDVVGRSER